MGRRDVFAPARPTATLKLQEDTAAYHLVLSLRGIDLWNLHVFTSPRSVSIELRSRRSFPHKTADPIESDAQIQRISREVRFRERIERGKACASMVGNTLDLTLPKATTQEDGNWSEWVVLDTSGSLGCFQPNRSGKWALSAFDYLLIAPKNCDIFPPARCFALDCIGPRLARILDKGVLLCRGHVFRMRSSLFSH
jgi:HSP20 family molecular chaperone IbpA